MSLERSTGLALFLIGSVAIAEPQQPKAQPSQPAHPAAASLPAPPAAASLPAPPPAASDNKVATTEALHLLVLPMKGSYLQHPSAFERLGTFFSTHGVSPLGPPVARYFSDPSVGEANLVWEVGLPVAATVKAEAPFEIKDIPATLSAVHVHKGSYEELGTAWGTFMQWVASNGYRPAGAPLQVFLGNLGSGGPVEMRVPVEK